MKDTMKYKNFLGSVDVSIKDGVIHGKLLFINDLITYEAETINRLKAEFEAAVDDYLETCKTLDREPLKPFSGTFNVRIGAELHQQVGEYAIFSGISANEVVKKSISCFFEEQKQKEIIHKHIHTIRTYKTVTIKESPFFPTTEDRAGGSYALTLVQ